MKPSYQRTQLRCMQIKNYWVREPRPTVWGTHQRALAVTDRICATSLCALLAMPSAWRTASLRSLRNLQELCQLVQAELQCTSNAVVCDIAPPRGAVFGGAIATACSDRLS
jgi:hypothetical protein